LVKRHSVKRHLDKKDIWSKDIWSKDIWSKDIWLRDIRPKGMDSLLVTQTKEALLKWKAQYS
jgi:hypothetical protein